MSVNPPPRPQKGQPIAPDWFLDFYDYCESLKVSGDLRTTKATRSKSGTVISAINRRGSVQPQTSTIIAQIDTDYGDGTYAATEQKNAAGTFSDADSGMGMTFDSGNNGVLHALNGEIGVPIGSFVEVLKVNNTSGGPIWYFEPTPQYGVTSGGAWVKITANTGSPYSWAQLDPDAVTATSPAVTGSSNLYEVNGFDGYIKDQVVWARFDGTNFQFTHHHRCFWAKITSESASGVYDWTELQPNASTATSRTGGSAVEASGRVGIPVNSIVLMMQGPGPASYRFEYDGGAIATQDSIEVGTSTSANSDTWARDSQGAFRGVLFPVVCRLSVDGASGAVYAFSRIVGADANGHVITISAESRSQVFTLDPTAITCTTELLPNDASISSSLVARLIADDISGSDGDAVASWTAAVGSAATQGNASFKPTLKTALYNGHNAVRFDGTDDYLDWGTVLQGVETGAFTLFAVAVGNAAAIVADYWRENTGAPFDTKKGVYFFADGRFDTNEYQSANISDSATTAGLGSLAVQANAVTNNGSTRNALYLNGAEDTTSITGGAISCTVSPSNTYIGAIPATAVDAIANFLTGDVCELIIYSAKLTAEQIEQISCYLMTKYGI